MKINQWEIIRDVGIRSNCRIVEARCSCGNIFIRNKRDILIGKSKSCGHGNYIGKNNPNWRGGHRNKGNNIRKSKKYIEWRDKCFNRDNYTCQISGEIGGRLVVHHLTPFSILFNDVNGEIIYDDLIWDINNGITISEELHKKFHKIYGTKNFTRENFIEFSLLGAKIANTKKKRK